MQWFFQARTPHSLKLGDRTPHPCISCQVTTSGGHESSIIALTPRLVNRNAQSAQQQTSNHGICRWAGRANAHTHWSARFGATCKSRQSRARLVAPGQSRAACAPPQRAWNRAAVGARARMCCSGERMTWSHGQPCQRQLCGSHPPAANFLGCSWIWKHPAAHELHCPGDLGVPWRGQRQPFLPSHPCFSF